ncbi:MAG: DUF4157 domain-containing protein, partial [Myxococcales bacterium]|nr:DUF4157 domain-containing protein [Myxococcales bacterium]
MKNQRQTAPDGRATAKSAQHEKPPAKHERERGASESIAPSRALARMTNSPRHVTPGDVRTLQHTIGNHAIGQLLLGGHRSAPPRVQRKALTVGAANDIFEQRAEAAADEIMRMPDDAATPVSEEVLQPRVQRSEAQSAAGAGSFQADADFTSRVEALGSGAPLDRATRDFMEPRFGSNLGHLRVQDGPRAAELNREIGARAFTHEHQIVMGEGAYNPGTTAGRHLLAHEITHTFQQRATHHHVIQRQVYKSKADRTVITWQAFKAKLKKKGYSSAVIQSMHETFVSYKSVSTPDTTEEALLKKAAILASGVAAEVD